jgi:hypothetical protein
MKNNKKAITLAARPSCSIPSAGLSNDIYPLRRRPASGPTKKKIMDPYTQTYFLENSLAVNLIILIIRTPVSTKPIAIQASIDNPD